MSLFDNPATASVVDDTSNNPLVYKKSKRSDSFEELKVIPPSVSSEKCVALYVSL